MSSQTPAGWYDDPDNPEQLRYFDGILWTSHVTPRISPTAAQSHIGAAPPVPPAREQVGTGGTGGAPQWPQQPWPQQPWQQQVGGRAGQAATTADGQPLASPWARLGARILDGVLTSLLGLLALAPWWSRILDPYLAAIDKAMQAPDAAAMQARLTEAMGVLADWAPLIALITGGVALLYEVIFLGLRDATPGKMLLGLRVRRTGAPGRIGWATALRRQAVSIAADALALVQMLAFFGTMLSFTDAIWLLFDARRQALHDKVADTQVVRTR